MRSHPFFIAVPMATLMLAFSATTAPAQTTIWGLQPGDSFRTQTIVERKNTLQLGEADESVQKTTDTFTFEYRVLKVLSGGNVSIQVRVIQANRETGAETDVASTQQLPALRKIVVIATVDPDGVIQDLAEYDNAISELLDSHQSGHQLINQSVSREVFTSWISYPFWMPAATAKSEHSHQLSLGLLGQLKTTVTCEAGQPETGLEFTKVTITGVSPDIAPTSVGREPAGTVFFTNVQAKMDSFRGQGTVSVPTAEAVDIAAPVDEPDQPTAAKRPLFEDMTLELSCSGEATLHVADSIRTLRFQHQQKITSQLLPGYRLGRRSRYPLFIRP